jgi:hypothetical protein
MHAAGHIVADVGLRFSHHATVQEHLVWPEDSGTLQFAAMESDVLKESVNHVETAVDADFLNIVKMGVSHFRFLSGDFGQGASVVEHGRCPFTL